MDSEEHSENSAEKRKGKPSFSTPELTIGSLQNQDGRTKKKKQFMFNL